MKVFLMSFILFGSSFTHAVQNTEEIAKVTAKCFVNLYGGQQTIYYRVIDSTQLNGLADSLVNSMIVTLNSGKKKKVYQAKECVLKSEDFSDPWARQIEEKTPD